MAPVFHFNKWGTPAAVYTGGQARPSPPMHLIDTHCHLDGEPFDDGPRSGDRAGAGGGRGDAGGDRDRRRAAGSGGGDPAGGALPFIYATVGVHPHDAAKATPDTWRELRRCAAHPKVRRGGRDRPGLPLRFLAARRAAGGLSSATGDRARGRAADRDPHARGLGRHRGPAAGALGRARGRHLPLFLRRSPRRPSRRWRWASTSVSPAW